MTQPFLGGPLVLIVDDNPGRIEYSEHFLFQNGFQTLALSVDEMKHGIGQREIDLVLTYLPIEPKQFADSGIPVLFMVSDETTARNRVDTSSPPVAYLPVSAGPDALIGKITSLTNR